jgi:hypothetical protein
VQVDLLLAKPQRCATLTKGDDLDSEHPAIEIASAGDIGDGKHEMIEAFDLHQSASSRCSAAEIATSEKASPAVVLERTSLSRQPSRAIRSRLSESVAGVQR